MRSRQTRSSASSGKPFSKPTRSRKAPANSISPRMARSVIAETFGFSPAMSASSSRHSQLMMVEIHVGDEQPLAAVLGRHHIDVSGGASGNVAGKRQCFLRITFDGDIVGV